MPPPEKLAARFRMNLTVRYLGTVKPKCNHKTTQDDKFTGSRHCVQLSRIHPNLVDGRNQDGTSQGSSSGTTVSACTPRAWRLPLDQDRLREAQEMQYGTIEPRTVPSHHLTQEMPAPNETGPRVSRQENGRTLDSETLPSRSISPHHGPLPPHLIPDSVQPSLRHLQHGLPDSFGRISNSR